MPQALHFRRVFVLIPVPERFERTLPDMNADIQPLAAIHFNRHDDVDALLRDAVAQLIRQGKDVAGVLQGGTGGADAAGPDTCDIDNTVLQSIRGGWTSKILEDRGQHARGCRLNPRAIADVAGRLQGELASGAELLVINRFGRAESEGHGLRNIFELAVESGIPVLTAVREDYADDWNAFHGGMAADLPAEAGAVMRWCNGIRDAA